MGPARSTRLAGDILHGGLNGSTDGASDAPGGEHEAGVAPPVGSVVAGKYRVERHLGAGAMGAVVEALELSTGQRYAMKFVLRRGGLAAERLLREARLAGRIQHPNVVRVFEVGEHEGTIFLVMELLTGAPMSSMVDRAPHPVSRRSRADAGDAGVAPPTPPASSIAT